MFVSDGVIGDDKCGWHVSRISGRRHPSINKSYSMRPVRARADGSPWTWTKRRTQRSTHPHDGLALFRFLEIEWSRCITTLSGISTFILEGWKCERPGSRRGVAWHPQFETWRNVSIIVNELALMSTDPWSSTSRILSVDCRRETKNMESQSQTQRVTNTYSTLHE